MRLFLLFLGVSILGVLALTACNSAEFKNARTLPGAPQNGASPPADGAARVTIAELKGMVDRNEVFVVDVRAQAAYDAAHIRGAKLIPEGEILKHLGELPKNKLIVTYCS
jgi:Rhodanese-like domain